MYAFLKGVMRLVTRTYLIGAFEVTGLEHVPRQGALLVCPNHRSTVDPPMVPAFLPRPDTWSMAKSEYFTGRGFKRWLFSSYHAFPVVRHTADRAALRRSLEILAAGQALVLYPEGRRVESGGLQEPEPGAGFIAQRGGVTVLPVGLVGTAECFPKGAHFPRRHRVEVRFGSTFCLRDRAADGSRIPHLLASEAIMLRIGELLPPELRGRYSDLDALRARVQPAFAV